MEVKKEKRKISLARFASLSFMTAVILSASLLAIILAFGIFYLIYRTDWLLLILAILLPLFAVLILGIVFFIARNVNKIFFKEILPTTEENYKAIYNEKSKLTPYAIGEYDEVAEVNKSIDKINAYYKNVNILNNYLDYSHISLVYYSKELNIVTDESFKAHIKELISASQTFRNAVVQIDYEIPDGLDSKAIKAVITSINSTFKQHGMLVALYKKQNGFYILVPKISALSSLKDNLTDLVSSLTITRKTIDGIQLYSPRVNCVIYPYSQLDNIFSDLRYISSSEKRMNLYIPKRLGKQKNDSLLHSTMNINAMNKIMTDLSSVGRRDLNTSNSVKEIGYVLEDLIAYLDIDEAGIVLYDADARKYKVANLVQLDDAKPSILPHKTDFPEELIVETEKVIDSDGSYYFSNRDTTAKNLARICDIFDISGGFFFVSTFDSEKHKSFIYFVNSNDKELTVDSYIRESLLICSSLIAAILTVSGINGKLELMKNRENNLYKLTNIQSYNVNRNTYEILDCSTSLREANSNIKAGEKCYKAIFGLTAPCKNCPLHTRQKIIKEVNGVRSEVSFSVNNKINNQVELLISPLEEGEISHNRFEPDFGINSLYALTTRIDNFFITRTKGYIVLVTVDNQADILNDVGNEGFAMLFRLFAEDIHINVLKTNEMYLIRNDVIAIVLPELGKLNVIDILEEIHKLSKKHYLQEEQHVELSLAYSSIKFPQQFASTEDVMRHIEQVLVSRDYKLQPQEFIYMEENDFYRPASRTDYILSIIDDAVVNNKFIIKAQPVVVGKTKHIDGAELLIRLSDSYRDSMLNTDELVAVAAKNNKLNLISDLLINYTCSMYDQFGQTIFKNSDFSHLSLNVDYNFFIQENFMNNLNQVIEKNKLPKNYIIFEITERDFAIHYNEFRPIIAELHKLNCFVACDRYTGQHLSIEKIADLHLDEVKIDRTLISDIDVISDKFESLKSMLDLVRANNLNVCLVGVENGQQYKLIQNYYPDAYMQGYYFHHPLDQNELIDRIKKVYVDKV